MKKVIILMLCVLSLCGCNKVNDEKVIENKGITYKDIMKEDNYIIVDVRTKEEYKDEHVKGAINIPYDDHDALLKLDKNKYILVYCRSGNRSGQAYTFLKGEGYDVMNIGAISELDLEKE